MLNLLQHYQKMYQNQCSGNSQPTSPTQLCQRYVEFNSKKDRRYTNCVLPNPGHEQKTFVPSQNIVNNSKYYVNKPLDQKSQTDLWIGVL